ncbi:MAG: hypothetical protein KAV82_01050 [Phycisphaerae bacterium]|nr:hypothetical protein [Phycisphaerae bacterium]
MNTNLWHAAAPDPCTWEVFWFFCHALILLGPSNTTVIWCAGAIYHFDPDTCGPGMACGWGGYKTFWANRTPIGGPYADEQALAAAGPAVIRGTYQCDDATFIVG